MKVVFLKDVDRVGKIGEVKEVADGYGRNFLVPHGLALTATAEAVKQVKAELETRALGEARTEAEILEVANKLEGKEVTLAARTGDKGKLYGSITAADIAAELKRAIGLVIDKRKIEIKPIRQVGSYEAALRLSKDIVPKIKVTVSEKTA